MKYTYAINFAPGFEGLVASILSSIGAEVIFSEEAFALIGLQKELRLDKFRFAKSIIEVFDYSASYKNLKLVLPHTTNIPEGRTFSIRNFDAGRPVKMDQVVRVELIRQIANNTKLRYSAFEPDVDFVVAKRRDGMSYFGCKLGVGIKGKTQKGEVNSDIANLLIELGEMKWEYKVLDAFSGHGGISKELVAGFDPSLVTAVEKDSTLVNRLKSSFGNKSKVRVVASDVVNFLKSTEIVFDLIVADPPWGEFEEYKGDLGKLYTEFLKTASSKLTNNGRIVIMSSAKDLLENAVEESDLKVAERIDALVSGKKVLVLKLAYER